MSSRLSPCSLGRSRSSWHPACSCSCSDTQDVHHLAGEELAPSPRGSKRSLFSQPCLRSALLAIVLFVLIKNRETSRGQRAMAEMLRARVQSECHCVLGGSNSIVQSCLNLSACAGWERQHSTELSAPCRWGTMPSLHCGHSGRCSPPWCASECVCVCECSYACVSVCVCASVRVNSKGTLPAIPTRGLITNSPDSTLAVCQ
jgi:hypothetical protein